jgi:hypothetical protein
MDDTAKQRMKAVLAAYGADPARWPAGTGDAAAELAAELREAAEIDHVLKHAAKVEASAGAMERMLARLPARPATAEIVQLSPPKRRPIRNFAWALPLAASLLIGVYLGAAGTIEPFLGATGDDASLAWSDGDVGSGLEEAEAAAEDGVS